MYFSSEQIQMIRSECAISEETREITEKVLDFMKEQKLFKLFVPEEYNGKNVDFPSAIKIFQDASYIDGNFGWLVTIGSGGGMFVPNMTEEAAREFYTPKNAVIAGSGYPAGKAKPTDDGYIINGKWFYCSGSQYASLFTVTCVLEKESDNEILAFALEPDQVEVLGDWDAFGLKGTSSHSIQIQDQFVPSYRAFSVFEQQNSHGSAVHTLPFQLFSEASFAAITLGLGRHFLDELEDILQKNKENWKKSQIKRYELLHRKLNEEKIRLEKAIKSFHQQVNSIWDHHVNGNELTGKIQQEFSAIAKRSATTSIYCTDQLFRYIGMQAVMEKNVLNRIWRDLHTAGQHMYLTPNNVIESEPFSI